jgi:hypothetical protein
MNRHHDIEDDEIVVAVPAHGLHGGAAIFDDIHPKPGSFKNGDEDPADMRFVFGDEEPMRSGRWKRGIRHDSPDVCGEKTGTDVDGRSRAPRPHHPDPSGAEPIRPSV